MPPDSPVFHDWLCEKTTIPDYSRCTHPSLPDDLSSHQHPAAQFHSLSTNPADTFHFLYQSEFLTYARELYREYEQLLQRYGEGGSYKKKFAVSTQHYSFAVKAFVDVAKKLDMSKYELAIRETKTMEVIQEVSTMKSEIGVLYLNEFNRKSMEKLFKSANLEFHPLISCKAYVYLWKGHPLADEPFLTMEQLEKYPCLSFEQGDKNSFYFAEEVFSTLQYKQMIKADDRATMLNLMVGMNGYTLCSGIICEELNGDGYSAIPLETDEKMTIGYIKRKGMHISHIGKSYIEILRGYA